jgi:hypothetical protein
MLKNPSPVKKTDRLPEVKSEVEYSKFDPELRTTTEPSGRIMRDFDPNGTSTFWI